MSKFRKGDVVYLRQGCYFSGLCHDQEYTVYSADWGSGKLVRLELNGNLIAAVRPEILVNDATLKMEFYEDLLND